MMEAMKCMLSRRSVRKYQSMAIPDDVLEEIIRAGLYAPSAINLQHWHFVVIRSEEKRREFGELMQRVQYKFNPVLQERFAKHPETIKETETFLTTLGGAPVVVLAFLLKDSYPDRDGAVQSVSAAIENVLLAAWDKGIGSCWMTAAQRMEFGPELQERFAPDKGEFVASITLGYPDETGKTPPRRDGRFVMI